MTVPTQQLMGIQFNLNLTTLEEIRAYCTVISKTEMVPKAYRNKPDDIMVVGSMGQALGMNLFMAMQSIASINGIPSVYGDAGLALVRQSGLLEDFEEWLEIDGQKVVEIPDLIEADKKGHRIVRFCKSKRKGSTNARITAYSVTNAKTAKLWLKKSYEGKDTPWCTSPDRMLMFRARGFNLRDEFGDVLKGFDFTESVQDYDLDMHQDETGAYKSAESTIIENGKKAATSMADTLKANAPKTVQTVPAQPEGETEKVIDSEYEEVNQEQTQAETPPPPPEQTPPAQTDPVTQQPTTTPATPPSLDLEIAGVLGLLTQNAKGTALLNGIRKMFKMKADETKPADPQHHPLYLQALKDAQKKL